MKSLLFLLPLAFFIISCDEDSVSNVPQSEIILSEYFYPQPHSEWEYELYTIKSDGTIDYSNPVTEIHTRGEAPEDYPEITHIDIERTNSDNTSQNYLISETSVKRVHIGQDGAMMHDFFLNNEKEWLHNEETYPSKYVNKETNEEIIFPTVFKTTCERLEDTKVMFEENEFHAIRFDYITRTTAKIENNGKLIDEIDKRDTTRYTFAKSLGLYSMEKFPNNSENAISNEGLLLKLKSINK